MPALKRIIIIDDHPLFREGIKSLIGNSRRYEIVCEAGSAAEGMRMIKEFMPDLALVDISLPDRSGIMLTREIRTLFKEIRILIISMHAGIQYIAEAFQAGATGYVVKESAHKRLLDGIEAVLKGEYFIDSTISHDVVKALLNRRTDEAHIADPAYARLTSREQEVTRLLAEGFTLREIGEMLYISPKTVENHRTNIMNKLEIHGIHELIRYAARIGLIDVDSWKT